MNAKLKKLKKIIKEQIRNNTYLMIGLFLYRRNVTFSHKGMVKDIIEQFKKFCKQEGWIQEQIAEIHQLRY